jgi:hypothetical protein
VVYPLTRRRCRETRSPLKRPRYRLGDDAPCMQLARATDTRSNSRAAKDGLKHSRTIAVLKRSAHRGTPAEARPSEARLRPFAR